jgi:hypothetical protein
MSTPTIIVIDDFHPDAAALRNMVVSQQFKNEVGPDGETYRNILKLQPGCEVEAMAPQVEAMEKLISAAFNGRKINTKLSFFRLDYAGEPTKSFCHADSICAKHAGILYLNEPDQCQGGTAFWRHIPLGLDMLPTDAQMAIFGSDSPAAIHQTLTAETKNPDRWQQTGFVGMKFNRFAAYPSKMWHSRYPHEAFGESNSTGRLVWVTFFDLE